MNPFLSLALSLAPALAGALSRPGLAAAAEQAVRAATGAADAAAAEQMLARDPALAARLRGELVRLLPPAAPAPAAVAAAALAWTPALVSALVLLAYGAAMWAAMTRTLPVGSQTTATMLLGTLAAMATSVVSYWVGSSAGSAAKTELLFRAPGRGAVPQPPGSEPPR